MKTLRFPLVVLLLCGLGLGMVSCSDDDDPMSLQVIQDGTIAVQVVIPNGSGAPLQLASEDFRTALQEITGLLNAPPVHTGTLANASSSLVVEAAITPSEMSRLTDQGYALQSGDLGQGKRGIRVTAATEVGAMYGIYKILDDMGVEFHHPEESFHPLIPEIGLPEFYDGTADIPDFELRGFHEHTQHPIPMSDYFLRTDDPAFRDRVSTYIKWLARNRQNAMSFHFLKTVDRTTWIPYISGVVDEAQSYGIRAGMVTGFADQQQNAYTLIEDLGADPAPQIRANLDELLAAGFDFITLQYGTSEFTSQPDAETLGWINTATAHIRDSWPGVRIYGWIHIFCEAKDEQGGYFYHLPLQADPDFGAWVHTTMFYALEQPAPVYRCDDFNHQVDFMQQADGTREQVFFPETAWWLGFDNNMPMGHPLTGWSRMYDIQDVLSRFDVTGHITFTTGREWGYWQYDHYLCKATWDREYDWDTYLEDIAPLFGPDGGTVAAVLKDWTQTMKRHFYDENADMYFYLSGERPEDIAEVAHPIRPQFREIVEYSQAEYDAWYQNEYLKLGEMLNAYETMLARLAPTSSAGVPLQNTLYRENYLALEMFPQRLRHIIALYDGAMACRAWDQERRAANTEGRVPDDAIRTAQLDIALNAAADANLVLAGVMDRIHEAEGWYRYPLDILAEEKPESLTVYPFGSLFETSTGYYWTRRADEFDALVDRIFNAGTEAWSVTPDIVFHSTPSGVLIVEPNQPLLSLLLQSFLPNFIFGFEGYNAATGGLNLHFAEDYDRTGLPDPGTEVTFPGTVTGGVFDGSGPNFDMPVRDTSGVEIGALSFVNPDITAELTVDASGVTDAVTVRIDSNFEVDSLISLVVDGIGGYQEEDLKDLIRPIWGIPAGGTIPAELPIGISFSLQSGDGSQ